MEEQIETKIDYTIKDIPKWIWVTLVILLLILGVIWYSEISSNKICGQNHEETFSAVSGFFRFRCFAFEGETIIYRYKFGLNGWGLEDEN